MPHIAVHNGTAAPLLVDEGRVIGAGEFGVADSRDPAVKQLLASESLRKVDVDPDATDVDPDATAAVTAAADRNDAARSTKPVKAADPVADGGDQSAPKSSRRGA